jgi:hypothetical protein
MLSSRASPDDVRGTDGDLVAIADIISSTFSAAYLSAALDKSVVLLAFDGPGLTVEALFLSKNDFHFSE